MEDNPIYKYLKEQGLTDLNESDFVAKYSQRENLKQIYDYLKSEDMTDLDFDSFGTKYFPLPKKEEEVSSQGSEATSMKLSEPSGMPLQETRTLENQGVTLPEGWVVDYDNYGNPIKYDPNDPENTVTNILSEVVALTPKQKEAENLTFLNSVKNSVLNIKNQLEGFDDRLRLLSADLWENVLGRDLARAMYSNKWLALGEGARDIDQVRQEAYAELTRLGQEALPTLQITQGLNNNDFASFAGGIINGATSIISTAISSGATGGAGLVTDMVGQSVYDYNTEKARALGISTEQLLKDGKADFMTPAIIGGIASALEAFGLRGMKGIINANLTGTFLKNASIIGLEINKEGMTEWVQTGLEEYNRAKAVGASDSDAMLAMWNKMQSQEGLESYLQGLAGSGVSGAVGNLTSRVINNAYKVKIEKAVEEINNLTNDLQQVTDPTTREGIVNKVAELTETVLENQSKSQEELSKISLENQVKLDDIQQKIDELEAQKTSGGENLSEETKTVIDTIQKDYEAQKQELLKQQTNDNQNQTEVPSEVEVGQQEAQPLEEIDTTPLGYNEGTTDKSSFLNDLTNQEARSNRISSLEERIKSYRRRSGNLGISGLDPEQEAQHWRDVTEYAVLKIVDGTVKTAKQLGKALGISEKDTNLIKAFDDATKMATPLLEATVTPKKQTVKSTIRKATDGKISGTVTVTNRQALVDTIKTLNRGAKDALTNVKELSQTISGYLDANKKRLKGAKFPSQIVSKIAKSVSGITNQKQLDKALNIVDRAIDDAEFRQKLNLVDRAQSVINRMAKAKSTPRDLKPVLKEFAKINPVYIDENQLDNFLNDLISVGRVGKSTQVTNIGAVEMQRYIDMANAAQEVVRLEREMRQNVAQNTPEAKQSKIQSLKDKLVSKLGIDQATIDGIDDGTKGFNEVIDELQQLIDSNTKSREESTREIANEYEKAVKQEAQRLLDAQQTDSDRRALQEFLDADVKESNIPKSQLSAYIVSLYNLYNNGSIVGLGRILNQNKVTENVKNTTATKEVTDSFKTPARSLQWFNKIGATSGSLAFGQILKNMRNIGKVHEYFGFIDVQMAGVKAFKRIEKLRKDIGDIVKKHRKDLENDPVSNTLLAIYADVVQYRKGWTPEQIANEYSLRIKAWGESLNRLERRVGEDSKFAREAKTMVSNMRKALEKVAKPQDDSVTGTTWIPTVNQQQIFDMLPEGQKAYYKFARDTYESLKNEHFTNSKFYGGLDIEGDWVNYIPRSYNNLESSDTRAVNRILASSGDSILDIVNQTFASSVSKENTGAGQSRLLSGDKLPLNRALNGDFMNNFINEAQAIIYDNETMGLRQFTSQMLDVERTGIKYDDLVSIDLYKEKVAQKVLGDKMSIRWSSRNPTVWRKAMSKARQLGSAMALGGWGQFIKQTTPLTEVLGRVGIKSTSEAMQLYARGGQGLADLLAVADVSMRDISNEYKTPKSPNATISNEELGKVRSMLREVGMKADDITNVLSEFSMTPLKATDNLIARIGWLAFYIDQAKKNNNGVVDLGKIDKNAVAYANTQNSIVMNESDSSMQAELPRKDWMRLMFPFSSFSVNATVSMVTSIDKLLKATTAQQRAAAISEVASILANKVIFNAIGFGLRHLAISGGAYLLANAVMDSDEDDEKKKELLEKIAKEEQNRQYINGVRSVGYTLQDLIYGGLFGDYSESLLGTVTERGSEFFFDEQELISSGYYDQTARNFTKENWFDKASKYLGTAGVFAQRVRDVVKLSGEIIESDQDYVTRRYQRMNAEKDAFFVDPFYIDSENIGRFDRPEWSKATNGINLMLAGTSLLGVSDQTTGSVRRYSNSISNKLLKDEQGNISQKSTDDALKEVNRINQLEVGGIKMDLTAEQRLWYLSERLNIVADYKKRRPFKKGKESLEDYEKMISSRADAKMEALFRKRYESEYRAQKAIKKEQTKEEKQLKKEKRSYGQE